MRHAWGWTDARCREAARAMARKVKLRWEIPGKPWTPDAPMTRRNRPAFYKIPKPGGAVDQDGTPIVASNIRGRGTKARKIRSTQMEPGVTVEYDSYDALEQDAARHGWRVKKA